LHVTSSRDTAKLGRDQMSRTCTVCRHPDRNDIDAALRAGTPYRDIARRFQLSKDAISRHRGNHLPQNEDADKSLPTGVAEIVARALALLDDAWTAETWDLAMLKVRQARLSLEKVLMAAGWAHS
jgi:hypothetical protein